MIRAVVEAARYRLAMRRARLSYRNAVDRGGRNWTREDRAGAQAPAERQRTMDHEVDLGIGL